jgi:hypothetical protein
MALPIDAPRAPIVTLLLVWSTFRVMKRYFLAGFFPMYITDGSVDIANYTKIVLYKSIILHLNLKNSQAFYIEIKNDSYQPLIINIIGYGVIGKTLAHYFLSENHEVYVYDKAEYVREEAKKTGSRVVICDDMAHLPKEADAIFLCLPTYTNTGEYTYAIVYDTFEALALITTPTQPIFITATGSPKSLKTLYRKAAYYGRARDIIYFPQFLREDYALSDFLSLQPFPSLIFGVHPYLFADYAFQLEKWKGLVHALFLGLLERNKLDRRALIFLPYLLASHLKLLDAWHLIMKITASNAYYKLLDKAEVDTDLLYKLIQKDKRLGSYGLVGGKAFGGKCLPNYLDALIKEATDTSMLNLLEIVKTLNKSIENE